MYDNSVIDERTLCCSNAECDLKDKCKRFINGMKATENEIRVSRLNTNSGGRECVWFTEN